MQTHKTCICVLTTPPAALRRSLPLSDNQKAASWSCPGESVEKCMLSTSLCAWYTASAKEWQTPFCISKPPSRLNPLELLNWKGSCSCKVILNQCLSWHQFLQEMASETTLLISDGKLNYKTNKQEWTYPSGHLSGFMEIDELPLNAQSLLQNCCRNMVGSAGSMNYWSEAAGGSSLWTTRTQCTQAPEPHWNPGMTMQGPPGEFQHVASSQCSGRPQFIRRSYPRFPPAAPSSAGVRSVWMDEGYYWVVMGPRAAGLAVSEFSGQGTVRMNSADRGTTGFWLSTVLGKFLTAPPLEFPCC